MDLTKRDEFAERYKLPAGYGFERAEDGEWDASYLREEEVEGARALARETIGTTECVRFRGKSGAIYAAPGRLCEKS